MKAMVFAAGLGTRLQPLTNNKPKAMVEVNGVPLIELVIRRLIDQGVTEMIVNVHHFANCITDFLKKKNNFGINIVISDETIELLDTGGGLINASWFFNDNKPFLVYNCDIISDINIADMMNLHVKSGNIATLAVRNRKTSRYFLFDDSNFLVGWKNMITNEIKISRKPSSKLNSYAFSGIHILNPEIFNLITERGAFSITNVYIRLAMSHKLGGYRHDNSLWMDLGKIETLREAEKILSTYQKF